MQIMEQISLAAAFTQVHEISHFCGFLYCSYLFSIFSTGQTGALAHTLNGSNDVLPHKELLFGG